jgi:adenosylmethionine-8-amino-7-oxononanoate aminotransferase
MGRESILERKNEQPPTSELLSKSRSYVWRPFTQAATACEPIPIKQGRGAILYGENGEEIIDAISSWWVTLHGHCHPYISQKIKEQIDRLEHVMFADFTHQPGAELAQKLIGILPDPFSRVFYTDNGSTAVEVAIKMSFQYWHNGNSQTKKRKIIAFREGYHGDTIGAMAVSDRGLFTKPFEHALFQVDYIDPPREGHEERTIAQFKELIETENYAAFIFEPIVQGVAGMKKHSAEGLDTLIGLAKEYGVLTIADEVMTGFGRTGPKFAIERLTNVPDMICLSKGLTGGFLPLGATVTSEAIYNRFLSTERSQALLHGHSFCGNPIVCSSAIASIDLLVKNECEEQRDWIEQSHRKFLAKWGEHDKIRRADLIGTILSLEYKSDESSSYYNSMRDRLFTHFKERNILMRPFGNSIHIVPPYCITESELNRVYEVIIESLTTNV